MAENPYRSPEAEATDNAGRSNRWRKLVWAGAILVVVSPLGFVAAWVDLWLRVGAKGEEVPRFADPVPGAVVWVCCFTVGLALLFWGISTYHRENTRRFRQSLLRISPKQNP